jgi:hypothetical protein
LALLAMYERTEQYQLAEELLDRMTKRFKTSCKVSFSVSYMYLEHCINFYLLQHNVNQLALM